MCDRFPGKFDVQTSYKPANYVLGLIFVVNIKFPPATYQQQKNSIVRVTGLDVKIYIIISIYVIKALFFLFPLLFPMKHKRSSPWCCFRLHAMRA